MEHLLRSRDLLFVGTIFNTRETLGRHWFASVNDVLLIIEEAKRMLKPAHLDNESQPLMEVRDLRTDERSLKNAMLMRSPIRERRNKWFDARH